jgi:hypothetical protein
MLEVENHKSALVALDKRMARAEDAAHLDTVDERG